MYNNTIENNIHLTNFIGNMGIIEDIIITYGNVLFIVVVSLWFYIYYKNQINSLKSDIVKLELSNDNYSELVQSLKNKNSELEVDRYRNFDNIIDLYKRIDILKNENTVLQTTVSELEAYKERQSSLRKNTIEMKYKELLSQVENGEVSFVNNYNKTSKKRFKQT